MADNYLERKMDDYRAGRLAQRPASSPRPRTSNDLLTLRYPRLRVLLWSLHVTPRLEALVKALRSVDMRVAVYTGSAPATSLCNRHGARCYPPSITIDSVVRDIKAHWGAIDTCIVIDHGVGPLPAATLRADFPQGADPAVIARAILFMLHPDNATLLPLQHILVPAL